MTYRSFPNRPRRNAEASRLKKPATVAGFFHFLASSSSIWTNRPSGRTGSASLTMPPAWHSSAVLQFNGQGAWEANKSGHALSSYRKYTRLGFGVVPGRNACDVCRPWGYPWRQVRLGIETPTEIVVHRREVYDKIRLQEASKEVFNGDDSGVALAVAASPPSNDALRSR